MNNNNTFIILLSIAIVSIQVTNCSEDDKIKSAVVESCSGCSLNRLSEVKQFIFEDVPLYDNVEFKKIPGAPPELLFLNNKDLEVERVRLSSLSRQECNELLINKGFVKKEVSKNEF